MQVIKASGLLVTLVLAGQPQNVLSPRKLVGWGFLRSESVLIVKFVIYILDLIFCDAVSTLNRNVVTLCVKV